MMIPGVNGSVLASAYKASKLKRRYADGGPIKPSAKLTNVNPQGQASYQAGLQSGPVNLNFKGSTSLPQFKNTSLQPSIDYKAKSLSVYLSPENVGGSYRGKSTYLNADYNMPTQQTSLGAGYNSDKLSVDANANLDKTKLMGAGVSANYNVTPNLSLFGDLEWNKDSGQSPSSYNVGFSYKKAFKDGGGTEDNDDKEMVEGVASILRRVKDPKNRLQLARQLSQQFNREGVEYSRTSFLAKSNVPTFKSGGQHGGLDRWFAEKWVDVKTGEDCGRSGTDKDGRPYPACRPSKRISSETPKTSSEMSSQEKAKFKATKTSSQRIPYNHKRN